MAVAKPKDNLKVIQAMGTSLKRHKIIILIILGHCESNIHVISEFQNL